MGHLGLHIIHAAAFYTVCIAVTLQDESIACNDDDTVYYVAAAIHPCQHHVTDTQLRRDFQLHTLTAANDEGQHAGTINGKNDLASFLYQPYRLFQDGNVFILQNNYGFQSKRCKIKHII